MQRFAGKVAVVTAAASGIGRATALRLAEEGATVVAIDISRGVEGVAAELTTGGQPHGFRTLDCTDKAAVARTFATIYDEYGNIDILVNGVGLPAGDRQTEFWCSEPETWDFVLDVSLKSTMLCSRQVVPAMRERRVGRIVNIASVTWMVPTPTFADYAAAKAGVVGFTRVLAIELAPFGVTVNAVSPGPIVTAQFKAHTEETKKRVLATIPLGRYGQPEDIAAGIAYLASDEAGFVTGHNLIVAGGRAIN